MAAPAVSASEAERTHAGAQPAVGFRHYRRFLLQIRVLGQCAFGGLAFGLAVLIRDRLPHLQGPMNWPTTAACGAILVGSIVAARLTPAPGLGRAPRELTIVAASTTVVLIALFFFRSIGTAVSRPTILLFAIFATAALVLWDGLDRYLLPRAAQVRNLVLVGGEGLAMAREFALGPWKIAAHLQGEGLAGQDARVVLERLRRLVREQPIDEILVASSIWEAGPEARELFRGVSELCEQTGVRLHVHAQWLSGYRQVHIDYLGDNPIVTFSFSVASPWLLAIKRAADVAVSALLLVVLSPALALIGLAVMLDSPGPALFTQVRCGLRGRPFRIYKFRSMAADAEQRRAALAAANEMSGPVFKLARDPRITRVGRWLRKTSLDELPQLWNVLRGEMSLVGPRPPLPEEVQEYHLDSLHRLAMKPGMTGLWQVSGRSAIRDFSAWLKLDAQYIREWSLWLDCKILVRTVGVLARMNGQ